MLIGELSKQSGLSRDTIRFYEKQGLIQTGRKERRFNNYKEYSQATLQRLLQLKRMKMLGLTLNEAAGFLDLIDNRKASCETVSQKMSEKIVLIDIKIAELQRIREVMLQGVQSCLRDGDSGGDQSNCPLLTTDSALFAK